MEAREGIEFINAEPNEVINFLKSRSIEKIQVSPSNLKIVCSGQEPILQVMNGKKREYLIRKTFLHKLLNWYNFPTSKLSRLSNETVISICNDYLLNISSEYVTVPIESDEALTLTSPRYNEITDLEIINRCAEFGIQNISRNDYMMRIITEDKYKFEAVKGDDCAIGMSIINSETGFRALSISHYILRYICSNGATTQIDNGNYRKIHYGHNDDEMKKFFDEQVTNALSKQKEIEDSIKKLSTKTAEEHIQGVSKRMESLLGKKEAKYILSNVEDNTNLYDLFNLITENAKNYDLSKRIYLESLAGELILN